MRRAAAAYLALCAPSVSLCLRGKKIFHHKWLALSDQHCPLSNRTRAGTREAVDVRRTAASHGSPWLGHGTSARC